MSDNSKISWCNATWNFVTGCTKISDGCLNCYIERTPPFRMEHRRFDKPGIGGKTSVKFHPDRLGIPLHWRKPRLVFVNSLADLGHEAVPDELLAQAFAVMAATRQHVYQILTKRPARIRSLLSSPAFIEQVQDEFDCLNDDRDLGTIPWPLPNVWVGVSVEDQKWANIRIPALLDTPAAVRWISAEPLLGPIDLGSLDTREGHIDALIGNGDHVRQPDGTLTAMNNPRPLPGINWVVSGGESGPHARPMHPNWARALRDQCVFAGVPFHFKQWGEWGPAPWRVDRQPGETDEVYKARSEATCATHSYALWADKYDHFTIKADHKPWSAERGSLVGDTHAPIRRWGKHAAGRELDGKVWDQYPEPVTAEVTHA